MRKARVKLASAIAGLGVVAAMGVLTVAFGGTEANAHVKIGGAGTTITSSTPPSTLQIPSANPPVKAKPFTH